MGQPDERGERLLLLLTPAEIAALDEFRRKHELLSRSAAVHEVLRRALGLSERMAARVALKASDSLPVTKPMTRPWHLAKKRTLGEPR
jgi:hypothetical protein